MDRMIHCPRCGYDMRTATAHWTESCPVDGTCSECGLVFHWVEVLQPERFVPWWWPEGTGRGRWIRRAMVTWFMALRPRRFWDAAQLAARPRPWRLVGCFLIVLLAVTLLYVGAQGASAARLWSNIDYRYNGGRVFIGSLLPRSPADATLGEAVLEAISRPLARQSQLKRQGYMVGSWPAPWFIQSELDDGVQNSWQRRTRKASVITLSLIWRTVAAVVVLQLLQPLLFILLPMTRKRAKVRWRHLGRIAVCSFLLPVWAVALTLVGLGVGAAIPDIRTFLLWSVTWIIVIGLPLWLMLWWTRAIGRYLRMPHALAVSVGLLVIAALLPIGLAVLAGQVNVVIEEADLFLQLLELGFAR